MGAGAGRKRSERKGREAGGWSQRIRAQRCLPCALSPASPEEPLIIVLNRTPFFLSFPNIIRCPPVATISRAWGCSPGCAPSSFRSVSFFAGEICRTLQVVESKKQTNKQTNKATVGRGGGQFFSLEAFFSLQWLGSDPSVPSRCYYFFRAVQNLRYE